MMVMVMMAALSSMVVSLSGYYPSENRDLDIIRLIAKFKALVAQLQKEHVEMHGLADLVREAAYGTEADEEIGAFLDKLAAHAQQEECEFAAAQEHGAEGCCAEAYYAQAQVAVGTAAVRRPGSFSYGQRRSPQEAHLHQARCARGAGAERAGRA